MLIGFLPAVIRFWHHGATSSWLALTNDECPRHNGAGIRNYRSDSASHEAAEPAEALNTDGAGAAAASSGFA